VHSVGIFGFVLDCFAECVISGVAFVKENQESAPQTTSKTHSQIGNQMIQIQPEEYAPKDTPNQSCFLTNFPLNQQTSHSSSRPHCSIL